VQLWRVRRGATGLTESGLTFREHAVGSVAKWTSRIETILPAGELCGRLRIAAPLSLGATHFAHRVSRAGARASATEVRPRTGTASSMFVQRVSIVLLELGTC